MDTASEPAGFDLDELVRRHARQVFRLVRRFASDSEEALALTQEALLRTLLRQDDLDSESAFEVCLYRMALDLSQDESRRRAWKQAREVMTHGVSGGLAEDLWPLQILPPRAHGGRLE